MSEAEGTLLTTPALLSCWLREEHIECENVWAAKWVFEDEICKPDISVIDVRMHAYAEFAKSAFLLDLRWVTRSDDNEALELIKSRRQHSQKLPQAAKLSKTSSAQFNATERRKAQAINTRPYHLKARPNGINGIKYQPRFTRCCCCCIGDLTGDQDGVLAPNQRGNDIYRKVQIRLKVHAGLFYPTMLQEFGIPLAVRILKGEASMDLGSS